MRYKISFDKAPRECKGSPDFLMQLKSGKYIYIESYFCLNQPKYIDWSKTVATMTAYARGHKSECCLPVTAEVVCAQVCETMIKVFKELLNNSVFDLESYISREFARRIGAKEEEAFFTGDGKGKPLGVLAATGGAAEIHIM